MYPSLYQINTRILLQELSAARGGKGLPKATLDDIPDAILDGWRQAGFDWIWMLGVWQTGAAARKVSQSRPEWRREYEETLPDLREEDITGSPFAIQNYEAHTDFGGPKALARLRNRLADRGLKLMLDFVPNHTAPDHPWVRRHPEYYVHGSEDDLFREPHNYLTVDTELGERILAYGRDPYFAGWADTLQLNYRSAATREAMLGALLRVGEQCDGVRCDMAMLLLPDVIHRTWGDRSTPRDGGEPIDRSFWLDAIPEVKRRHPGFVMMAEVYWDLEWELQQQGFDYTYDKRLCDRLHAGDAGPVRGHLHADLAFQQHSARFLENHDEARAAAAFPWPKQQAAALVTFFTPGLRFFHEGQLEGRKKRVSMHLGRRPAETCDFQVQLFYKQLLAVLQKHAVREGSWRLADCRAAWDGNATSGQFLGQIWDGPANERLLVVTNYGPQQGQCRVAWPWGNDGGKTVVLKELLNAVTYERDANDLAGGGLYVDLPAWGNHLFEVSSR